MSTAGLLFLASASATSGREASLFERWPSALRDLLFGRIPEPWYFVISSLLSIIAILAVFGLVFAFSTLLERKLLARIQNRPGPNRSGVPFFPKIKVGGLSQPFADAVKMIIKEDIVPRSADKVLHFLAPVALVAFALLSFAVIPYGRTLVPVELDAAVLYFFAASAGTELAVFMAGWASRNKYSLLAAMRALAQLISYELPLLLSVVPVVMLSGSLSTTGIVAAQGGWSFGFLPHWFVLTPWGAAGFVIFMVAALAESNRSPFDLPEAESELIAGHLTEYSGFKYALFFMAEYFGMTALSCMGVTLFLGGWQAPCAFLEGVPSYVWFAIKLAGFIVFFMWVRGTLPRLRIDQLMRLAWKFMVPLALINLGNAAFWHLSAGMSGPMQIVRWSIAIVVVVAPFFIMSRRLYSGLGQRTYRFAT